MSRQDEVNIRVYDLLGHEVTRIFEGLLPAGKHDITWHPQDDLASGMYMIRRKPARSQKTRL